MFYSSPKHHFDTMFVILCVIAGATSLTISNTSKSSINQLNNHIKTSFMDFILDARLIELLPRSNTIEKDLAVKYSSDRKSITTKYNQQSQTVCTLFSNLLPTNHLKFCQKHQDVLKSVLPQVIQLAKKECIRITTDLKWNCSSIDFLFARYSPIAYTREAGFVRSILNASMMYLVAKACSDYNHRSCKCQNNLLPSHLANEYRTQQTTPLTTSRVDKQDYVQISDQDLSPIELSRLNSGSPIRLAKSVFMNRDCTAILAFANAFTKVFLDLDDRRTLDRALKTINKDKYTTRTLNRTRFGGRSQDSDYKELAFIKWTKSAINLHNNNVGRQMVREAIQRRCRCHGLSGVCQFKTCWDQLLDFSVVTTRLRSIYLSNVTKVEAINYGSFEDPDLRIIRTTSFKPLSLPKPLHGQDQQDNGVDVTYTTSVLPSHSLKHASELDKSEHKEADKIKPGDLLYLFESPEYCEPQPKLGHSGTKGRSCALSNNVTSKKRNEFAEVTGSQYIGRRLESFDDVPGSCKHLCCNRGYRSELVLDMVNCNCRFKYCCKVECEHCLRQRLQHYCL